MRELQRRYAYWPLNEALNGERLDSLERGLEKVNKALEKVDKDLDQQSSVLKELCLSFDELESKVHSMSISNSKIGQLNDEKFASTSCANNLNEQVVMKNR